MQSTETLLQLIQTALDEKQYPEQPSLLYQPQRYALESGGKRIRPLVVLMAANLYSDHISTELIHAALAVEVFHTFTLVHDDIMDNASIRRGRPTVYKKWNQNIAILSGDAMLVDAYQHLAQAPNLQQTIALFNQTATQVCEGQQYDVDFEAQEVVREQDYIHMIGLKTAVLLAAAAKIGALVSSAPQEQADLLYDFGYNLGIAFQLQDDYLDAFGKQETFGKQIGGDIVECKKTFLFIATHDALPTQQRNGFVQLMQNTSLQPADKVAKVKGYYAQVGVEQLAYGKIKLYMDKAFAALESLRQQHGLEVGELEKIAHTLLNRQN